LIVRIIEDKKIWPNDLHELTTINDVEKNSRNFCWNRKAETYYRTCRSQKKLRVVKKGTIEKALIFRTTKEYFKLQIKALTLKEFDEVIYVLKDIAYT
jgi:hypothetical protein